MSQLPRRTHARRVSQVGTTPGAIAGARLLQPFQQGYFDGLCGLYSTVNALRLLLQDRDAVPDNYHERLFRHGIRLIAKRGQLSAATAWGMSIALWHEVIEHLCKKVGKRAGVVITVTRLPPGPDDRIRAVAFAAIERAIDRQRPVLILLRGAYEHYTVICAYTSRRFRLHDSYAYSWIEKTSCAVTDGDSPMRHRLSPTALVILGVS